MMQRLAELLVVIAALAMFWLLVVLAFGVGAFIWQFFAA
jgi:hypothetical protein